MKMTPSTAAAASAAAALAVAGIAYAAFAPGPAATAVPAVQQVAASALVSGDGDAAKGHEGREFEEGRIEINEREYSPHQNGCVTVLSGLGAKTLNIRNESHRTIEVFNGAVCDSGAPIATVGPRSTSDGVKPEPIEGISVDHGVVASFRVVQHHEGHRPMSR